MDNSITFHADQDPNTIIELTPQVFPVLKNTLAQAFPEEYARANIIRTAKVFRIELNLSEDDAFYLRSALLVVKNRYKIHPN